MKKHLIRSQRNGMPYIHPHAKERLQLGEPTLGAGELNYLLTELCLEYMEDHDEGYATLNDIVGALELCKMEFNRRVVTPYEDKKIEDNGDVY